MAGAIGRKIVALLYSGKALALSCPAYVDSLPDLEEVHTDLSTNFEIGEICLAYPELFDYVPGLDTGLGKMSR